MLMNAKLTVPVLGCVIGTSCAYNVGKLFNKIFSELCPKHAETSSLEPPT